MTKKNLVRNYFERRTIPASASINNDWEDIADFPSFVCSVFSDQRVLMVVDFSMDKIDIHRTIDTTINRTSESIVFARIMRYVRVRITNIAIADANVSLQVIFGEVVGGVP